MLRGLVFWIAVGALFWTIGALFPAENPCRKDDLEACLGATTFQLQPPNNNKATSYGW